jgi:hypothetical protein
MNGNLSISEKYQKYLIKILIDDKPYYTVMSINEDGLDEVLINGNNQILFFASVDRLMEYGLQADRINITDKDNAVQWLKQISLPLEPYAEAKFNFDITTDVVSKRGLLEDVIFTIGLIEDYAYQVKNEQLLEILSTKEIIDLKDFFMDAFIWEGQGDIESKRDNLHIDRLQRLLKTIKLEITRLISYN